jgi:hypothetical protein
LGHQVGDAADAVGLDLGLTDLQLWLDIAEDGARTVRRCLHDELIHDSGLGDRRRWGGACRR